MGYTKVQLLNIHLFASGLRFIVREFYFDEKELKCEKEEMKKLASDKKQQYVSTWYQAA